jgi:hypothetical protein
MSTHEYSIQKLWDMIKRPNLRIHWVDEGAEIQTEGIENLSYEIITENFPNLCNVIDIHVGSILNSK